MGDFSGSGFISIFSKTFGITFSYIPLLAIPFAGGIAGIFLLCVHHFFVIDTVILSYMLIVVCSIWLIISVMVHRSYVKLLPGTLAKSKLIESTDEDGSQISFLKNHRLEGGGNFQKNQSKSLVLECCKNISFHSRSGGAERRPHGIRIS